jgi:hypothetical protein
VGWASQAANTNAVSINSSATRLFFGGFSEIVCNAALPERRGATAQGRRAKTGPKAAGAAFPLIASLRFCVEDSLSLSALRAVFQIACMDVRMQSGETGVLNRFIIGVLCYRKPTTEHTMHRVGAIC